MKVKTNIAISESGFLFDPMTGESYSMNQTGREILELIKEEKSEGEIKQIMTSKYDVDDSTFERYFVDFVGMLTHFQIVVK
jgi:hypothetical protein